MSKNKMLVLVVAVGAVVVAYCSLKCRYGFDDALLVRPVVPGVDLWGVSHVVMYFVAGAVWPDRWGTVLAVGVAWEGLEHLLSISRIECKSGTLGDIWYGQWIDLVFNAVGYVSGSAAGRLFRGVSRE